MTSLPHSTGTTKRTPAQNSHYRTVTVWYLLEATTTRAVDVAPVLSLERVREPGDILAVPVVIADLALLAQVFLAERALNVLEILHCLVALSFCGSLGCDYSVARLCRCSELGFELSDSVLEPGAIINEVVHDSGVLLGGGVGGGHGLCVSVCERAVRVVCSMCGCLCV